MDIAKRLISALLILLLTLCGVSGPYRVPDTASVIAADTQAATLFQDIPEDTSSDAGSLEAEFADTEDLTGSSVSAQSIETSSYENDDPVRIADDDAENFGKLLTDLVDMYEHPDPDKLQPIEADLDVIKEVSRKDHAVASAITVHWLNDFLSDDFQFCNFKGGTKAPELAVFGIPDSGHAIVVLGYALADGQMQAELIRRCNAAAAFANSYPSSIIVCTGGATGTNNPDNNTEAGLMKKYLSEECGIDATRIHIDEEAMNTRENAVNTLRILKENGISTMTIVTSDYHQRRARELYHAAAQLFRAQYGYTLEIIGNYCYMADPEAAYSRQNARLTARQIAEILGLPEEVIESLPQRIVSTEPDAEKAA